MLCGAIPARAPGVVAGEPVGRQRPAAAEKTTWLDELLDVEFSCLADALGVIGDWREDYNRQRPHSALGMKMAAMLAAEWTAKRLPAAA